MNVSEIYEKAKDIAVEVANEVKVAVASDVFDRLYQKARSEGLADHEAKALVLLQATEARFGANGHAMRYMRRFLLDTREEKMKLSLKQLMSEDSGVKSRIYGEVHRRANGLRTIREQRELNKNKPKRSVDLGAKPIINPIIDLHQRTYRVEDWKGALGAFPVKWEAVACPSTFTSPLVVRLSGEDVYDWHPEKKGTLRRLHEFAQSLVDSKHAEEFPIVADSETIQVDQINQSVDPKYVFEISPDHDSITEYATTPQTKLLFEAGCHFNHAGEFFSRTRLTACFVSGAAYGATSLFDAALNTKRQVERYLD